MKALNDLLCSKRLLNSDQTTLAINHEQLKSNTLKAETHLKVKGSTTKISSLSPRHPKLILAAGSLPDFLSEGEILGNLSSLQLLMYFSPCKTGCNFNLDKALHSFTPHWMG